MKNELEQFNRDMTAFGKSLPEKLKVFQKKVVFEALNRLVKKTPIDTGRARGNWQVTIGGPATGQLETTDHIGEATVIQGLAVLAGLGDYQVVWISNNVDYIEALEHGHSKQAPEGMLAVTVAELRGMFK